MDFDKLLEEYYKEDLNDAEVKLKVLEVLDENKSQKSQISSNLKNLKDKNLKIGKRNKENTPLKKSKLNFKKQVYRENLQK